MFFLIKLYQRLNFIKHQIIITFFGVSFACRHQPSCSAYTLIAVKKHGTIVGLSKGIKRILTCGLKP